MKLPKGADELEILKDINQITDKSTLSISYLSLFQICIKIHNCIKKYLRVRNSFGEAFMFLAIKKLPSYVRQQFYWTLMPALYNK